VKSVCVADFREAARRRLPKVLFDYIDGGSYAETTLAANVADFAAIQLRQRVMRDVSDLKLSTEVFGRSLSMPVILAPIGLAGMNARRGEAQAARAAQAAGVPFTLSTVAVCPIEEVTAAATAPWYQLYMIKDRGFMIELLARAEAAGCPALMFTVDLPVAGTRYRDARNGMIVSGLGDSLRQGLDGLAHPQWLVDVMLRGGPHILGNIAAASPELRTLSQFWKWVGGNFDAAVTWDDIAWVREHWDGPIIIKGVLDAEDAREARRRGADGVVVSNHGGRQLDGAASSISALPAVADAVGQDLTVLFDGGVRSGLDVLKALALGAKACLIGRAWVYALGADGQRGVATVLDVMRRELAVAMALTGCVDVRTADRSLLVEG